MHDSLMEAYGPQHWWPAQTSFEVIVGAYLTQNTAWKAVERSLDNLRKADALSVAGLRASLSPTCRTAFAPPAFTPGKRRLSKPS